MGATPPPEAIAELHSLTALTDLKLLSVSADYGLGSHHFRALGGLPHLRKLECDALNPSNEALVELGNLKTLEALHLHGLLKASTVALMRTFKSLQRLKALHLQLGQDRGTLELAPQLLFVVVVLLGTLELAPQLLMLRPELQLSLEILLQGEDGVGELVVDDAVVVGACDIIKALIATEGQPGSGSLVDLVLRDVTTKDPAFLSQLANLTSLTGLSLEEPMSVAPLSSGLTVLTRLSLLRSLTLSVTPSSPRTLVLGQDDFSLLCNSLSALTELQLWSSFSFESGSQAGED
eukprot:gene13828-19746_t